MVVEVRRRHKIADTNCPRRTPILSGGLSAADTGGHTIVLVGHFVVDSPPDRIGVRRPPPMYAASVRGQCPRRTPADVRICPRRATVRRGNCRIDGRPNSKHPEN